MNSFATESASAFAKSADGTKIYFEVSGQGSTALVLVHGWLGSGRWWDLVRDRFASEFQIVQIDLRGHGKSEFPKTEFSSRTYAEDIQAVCGQIIAEKIVLVGHSMSGAYILEAFPKIPKAVALIPVDTLLNLDQVMSLKQASEMFSSYRKDYKSAVENYLPQFLFAKTSPPQAREKILGEFLTVTGDQAVERLEPLYHMNLPPLARQISVPVRSINADHFPTNREANRKYFRDFDFRLVPGVGHYPMLENPEAFHQQLAEVLRELKLG